jgi:hypothetical protein
MAITTWDDLKTQPITLKRLLVEVELGEQLSAWTQNATYSDVYERSYSDDEYTLSDGGKETVHKILESVEEDGDDLTEQTSLSAVSSNAGSWWQDTSTETLYVHSSDSADPDTHVVVGRFWWRVSTQPVSLDGNFYEPHLGERGVPALSLEIDSVSGSADIGAGRLSLLNQSGFYNKASAKYLWDNAEVRFLLGGEDLPYSEYQRMFTGSIKGRSLDGQAFQLAVKSRAFRLLRSLPINNYWTSDYPNLDPDAEGTPIPYYYGSYSERQAPWATCVDTAYGTDQYQFKICDHEIKSITQVYINFFDGNGWQAASHANENLTNATFTITDASFVLGTTEVKVAFEGKPDVGGDLIERGPDIAEDILLSYCGYSASELDSTAFSDSLALTEYDLNVHVTMDIDALSLLETVADSDLAILDEDGQGRLRYRVWNPDITGVTDTIDETDFIGREGPSFDAESDLIYYKVQVGYSYAPTLNAYLFEEYEDSQSQYLYGDKSLRLKTFIRNATGAALLAQRRQFLEGQPYIRLRGIVKMSLIDYDLGDRVKVTLDNAPTTEGSYSDRLFEAVGLRRSFFPAQVAVTLRDLRQYGRNVGAWQEAGYPDWSTATDAEKQESGFWCDTNGFADSTDPDSKNVSRWW